MRKPAWLLLVAVATAAAGLPAAAAGEQPYGWHRLADRVRPPAAAHAAMAFDQARQELVLLPGWDEAGNPGGTWVRRDGRWARLQLGIEPPPRYASTMVFDADREEVVLFGGYGANADGDSILLNDTWTWDGVRWHREEPAASPPRQAYAAIAYDASEGEVVLFGGLASAGSAPGLVALGQTWVWNGQTWMLRETAASPPARYGAQMAFDEARDEVVLFGGKGEGSPAPCAAEPGGLCVPGLDAGEPGELADTWVWDGASWAPRTPTTRPPRRSSMAMAYDPVRERVVVFSGIDIHHGSYWDTWSWDGQEWTEVTPEVQPSPRFGGSMAFDDSIGEIVLFGGHRGSLAADTWGWDGSAWHSLETPAPPERLDAVMAEDPAGGGPLLFGGSGIDALGDTWVYEEGWRQLHPEASPPARMGAMAAHDEGRREVVLFGGWDASYEDLADTWAWDGQTWIERTPELPRLSPPPRHRAAMAYDAAHGETVLFGGENSRLGMVLSDTWTWDGAAWELRVLAEGPPALRQHMMAYDAARQEVVLYGGIDEANEVRGETWTWDGQRWTEERPPASPGPRAASMMVYDPGIERVVLVGGLRAEQPPLVWTWDGSTWTEMKVAPAPRRVISTAMVFSPSAGGSVLFGAGEASSDETWLLGVRGPSS